MSEFEVGDVVKLKSGGMSMTVGNPGNGPLFIVEGHATVIYENSKKELMEFTIPNGCLVKVEDE